MIVILVKVCPVKMEAHVSWVRPWSAIVLMVTLGVAVKVRNWKASTNSREWNSIKTRKIVQNSRSWLVSNRRTQRIIYVRFYASALFSLTRHSWLRKRSTVMFWPMRHVIFLEKIRYLYLPPKACFISMTNYKDDARQWHLPGLKPKILFHIPRCFLQKSFD